MNSRILDAGCGDGIHAIVLSPLVEQNKLRAYGIDASIVALNAAQSRAGKNWQFAEADLVSLPFPDEYFDVVYAFGSIEYTSSPRDTFRELCRVLRPGGKMGVWMLPKPTGLTGVILSSLRFLTRATGPIVTRIIADAIVPMLLFAPNQSGLNLQNATWRQCREAIMVNIASPQLTTYTVEEVSTWFADHGMMLDENITGIIGAQWGCKADH